MAWSIGFKDSVSFLLAIQATRPLTFASGGLMNTPTEHASLCWTHNRTGGFPASGFPTGFHHQAHERDSTRTRRNGSPLAGNDRNASPRQRKRTKDGRHVALDCYD